MPKPVKFPATLAIRALRLMVGSERPAAAVPAGPAPAKAIPA